MLSAILQKVYGLNLHEFLRSRLYKKLGILEDSGREWAVCPKGICLGTHGLALYTEELAIIGQMLLQDGTWKGERIVPAGWMREAVVPQIKTKNSFIEEDRKQGYGYHFWVGRHGTFRCEGAFGQECIVFPNENAVLVTTGGMEFGRTDAASSRSCVGVSLAGFTKQHLHY